MKRLTLLFCLVLIPVLQTAAQESDLEVKRNYESAYATLRERIDSAKTTATLDSLLLRVNALEAQYARRSDFLDRALYPETFASSIGKLRDHHELTFERVWLLQSQGIVIEEYEARIASMEGRIDTLTGENRRLMAELSTARTSLKELRTRTRALSQSLETRDRLIFALIDTIFLPYDKELNQVADVQKEAITRKLLKSNVVARVYDIAVDNVKFFDVTQPQGKEFLTVLDQYEQFNTKWGGLKGKMDAVSGPVPRGEPTGAAAKPAAGSKQTAGGTQPAGTTAAPKTPAVEQLPSSYVDSALGLWYGRVMSSLWSGVEKEFSSRGIALQPFTNGAGFTTAVSIWVDSAKTDGRDVSVFLDQVWKERIDKEWREVLERSDVLGKSEYAALDKVVSELGEKKFDLKLLLYVVVIPLLALLIWWVFRKKPAGGAPQAA